ncbi:secondary thiamine-phosphate synthase enzyme YjbQ [Anaerotruncus massiliensis (ex Togo et al. 2019)]|uniref:secondary thiamine-phosphate synthase enzyme YjbQ n=1 Tax=Anaerotruncus massiliensis (ex Togo et al. 2019) TaxID=1673720 RepID=UPI0027B9F350|nr:secondary thiamine-phosphate synthase enzyme YjbQ [Anaerotruncus massiliensis (ex Togo et al. 2019)]
MRIFNDSFTIQSEARPTFHDVTDRVAATIKKQGVITGVAMVYSQHTTCSVLIQEQSDDVNYYGEQLILQDLVNVLSKIIPTCETEGQYLHPGPLHVEIAGRERGELARWSLNTDAHLRSVLLGRSVLAPVIDGEPVLGEFGRIYFADFDQVRARQRTVRLTVWGD